MCVCGSSKMFVKKLNDRIKYISFIFQHKLHQHQDTAARDNSSHLDNS